MTIHLMISRFHRSQEEQRTHPVAILFSFFSCLAIRGPASMTKVLSKVFSSILGKSSERTNMLSCQRE